MDRTAGRRTFSWPAGSGKSHCAQAIGHAVLQKGYRVLYREAHMLLEELADATLDGNRKQHVELLTTVPLLIIDDLGMRKLPLTAAEELLEIIMRRYERASTLITSNRPVEDWGKLLGDSAAVSVVQKTIQHGGDGGTIAEQLSPVFHGSVRSNQRAGSFVASHDDFKQFLSGGQRQLAHSQVIDDEKRHGGKQFHVLLAVAVQCGVC